MKDYTLLMLYAGIILILSILFFTSTPINTPPPSLPQCEIQDTIELPHDSIPLLINALIHVESSGKSDAIGDTHLDFPSIGVLQIRPIMVREVNRILKKKGNKKRFKLKDRFNRLKSINMFMVWKNYYHSQDNLETIARNWNGGPRGYKRKQTLKYWAKVQTALREQR